MNSIGCDGDNNDVGATAKLADFIVTTRFKDLPDAIVKEGRRTFVNWLGCAIGGSRHEAVAIAIDAMSVLAGAAHASVLGKGVKFDASTAALINGISSHVFDFDDTHLKTIVHPAAPVASAALSLAEMCSASGADFMAALILGIEVECRAGNVVFPSHYDTGWHITGTVGPIGAAAAAARILGLDQQQMRWALGIGATQPVGLRVMFGTMTKSFHPGRAAQNGITAALLASKGYTGSDVALEGEHGWAKVLSSAYHLNEFTEGLGSRFESSLNSYKPFACGIVVHPVIDACIQLRNQHNLTSAMIERVELEVHPLVLNLTGKTAPKSGLEGKFSVYHACAVALLEGAAGEDQFSDECVGKALVVALRQRVVAMPVVDMNPASAVVKITVKSGETLSLHVTQAIGSVENPMSDSDLERKFLSLTTPVIGAARSADVLELGWKVDMLPDLSALVAACRGCA